MSRFILLLCGTLALPACSIMPGSMLPGVLFRSSPEAMQIRLLDVAYPLLTAAAEWCPFDQEPTYGFLLRDEVGSSGAVPYSAASRAAVAYVHPLLPAAQAGLSVNDLIVQVNTVNVAGEPVDQVGRLIDRLTRAKIQPLQLEVLNGTERRTVALSAISACHYAMQVLETPVINGISDGRRIGVTSGALQFFSSDDEVGWVVAHEIAHNILNHVENSKFQVMLRAFRLAWGEATDSPDRIPAGPSLEVQADYVGAYLMARAGYDLDAVRRVWERLQRLEARPGGHRPQLAQTHPPTKARLAAFALTLHEIEAESRPAVAGVVRTWKFWRYVLRDSAALV